MISDIQEMKYFMSYLYVNVYKFGINNMNISS